jgi:hypothetical protein
VPTSSESIAAVLVRAAMNFDADVTGAAQHAGGHQATARASVPTTSTADAAPGSS